MAIEQPSAALVEERTAFVIDPREVCHIACDDEGLYSYCGHSQMEGLLADCPGEYDGEAICVGCGRPNCPRCVQLEALDLQLKEADPDA